jgi:hypothetical protein
METPWRMETGKNTGYAAVLCRAVENELPTANDDWIPNSAEGSWEYDWIPDWDRASSQSVSRIGAVRSKIEPRRDLRFTRLQRLTRQAPRVIDLTSAIEGKPPVLKAEVLSESHMLSLGDRA